MTYEKPTKNLPDLKSQSDIQYLINDTIPILANIEKESAANKQERFQIFVKNYESVIRSLKNLIQKTEGLQKTNTAITEYENEFTEGIYSYERPSDAQELFDKIQKTQIIMFGDFHTLRRSQETFFNIFEKYYDIKKSDTKIVLCLEYLPPATKKTNEQNIYSLVRKELGKMTPNISQNQIDAYLNIIKFAKQKNIKIAPIDTRRKKQENQSEVDKKIANNIAKIQKTNIDSQVFVFIGESHLAPPHLPEKINNFPEMKKLEKLFIFQNLDEIYIDALKNKDLFNAPVSKLNNEDFPNKILKISNEAYSVQNVSLITKYQSLLEFADFLQKTELDESFDYADLINVIISYLTKNLKNIGIKLNEKEIKNSAPTIYFQKDDAYLNMIEMLDKKEIQELERTGCYLDRKNNNLFIKKFRLKMIAKTIGEYLFQKINKDAIKKDGERMTQEIFSMLCSRLTIPEKYKQPTFENKEAETAADQIFQKIFIK